MKILKLSLRALTVILALLTLYILTQQPKVWFDSEWAGIALDQADDGTKHGCACLALDALTAGWATPRAEDAESSGMRHNRGVADTLSAQTGQDLTSSPVATEKRGVLNPALSRWLMAYPLEWCACAVMAMQSYQPSRRNSSRPASKLLL